MQNVDFQILTDLHVLSPPEYEKISFFNVIACLSVCMYVCMYVCVDERMCTSLAPKRLDGFHSDSALKNASIVGECPVNTYILAPKIWALQMGCKIQMTIFSQIPLNTVIILS
jgi:hypothetical protein